MKLLLISLYVDTQIKALQPPSVLFKFKIIIKSANKQSLIQSYSMELDPVDEFF